MNYTKIRNEILEEHKKLVEIAQTQEYFDALKEMEIEVL